MQHQDKLKVLRELKKEDDVHQLLLEVLPRMGYKHVTLTHERGNKPEFGKDVVAAMVDAIEGVDEWTAFVVKHGKISGSSGVVLDVEAQVKECFAYTWKSIHHGHVKVNKVKVVANGGISTGAEEKILGGVTSDAANVRFWDDEQLVKFIDKHHPNFWIRGSKQYRQYAEYMIEKSRMDRRLKSFGINDEKVKKLVECAVTPSLSEWVKDEDGHFVTKHREPHSIISVPHNSLIVGDPGSGKSTLIDRLVDDLLKQNALRHDSALFPVVVKFKELAENDYDLVKVLKSHFTSPDLAALNIDVDEMVGAERCVIFIDALDELGDNGVKEESLQAVKAFREAHPKISLYCTSRTSDFVLSKSQELGFRYLRINGLSPEQVNRYLDTYFSADMVKCERLRQSLRDSEILEKMPKTPLTLTLIAIIFDETGVEIPATIADLYAQFVQVLLGGIGGEGVADLIDAGVKTRVLSHVAHHFHSNQIQGLRYDELFKLVGDFRTERGHDYDVRVLLDEIVGRSGLLYKSERDEFQFKHQSFQEYFTAYEYYHYRPGQIDDFVKKFNTLWWQNVSIFYAGMTKDSPELIQRVLKDSVPMSFADMVHNTGGLGRLIQALYNSPLPERKAAIERSLENTSRAIAAIEVNDDPMLAFWKNFSRFNVLQVLSAWFQMNHWSITLTKPLQEVFDARMVTLGAGVSEADKSEADDLHAYIIASMLTGTNFGDNERYARYLEGHRTTNVVVDALIDYNHQQMEKNKKAKELLAHEGIAKQIRRIRGRLGKIEGATEFINLSLKKIMAKTLATKESGEKPLAADVVASPDAADEAKA